MKKAFTLAEIMIVLVIIGVLSAILLPVAIHSVPDENIMKFKKGNNTIGTVIRELVNSDQYYANGDLGMKPDGTLIDGTHDGDNTYFCQTFADVVSTKEVNCSEENVTSTTITMYNAILNVGDIYQSIDTAKSSADSACLEAQKKIGAELITTDDISYYQTAPNYVFGIKWKTSLSFSADNTCNDLPPEFIDGKYVCDNARLFSGPDKIWHTDKNGFDRVYKIFCMDVDGINKGEDPFGYGIRADGKIFTGARADEWLKKSIQKGD